MKLRLLALFALCLTQGCKSEQEKNTEALIKAARQKIEDEAFRQNQKVELLEISSFTYKMVGEATLDTLRLVDSNRKFDYYDDVVKKYQEKTRENIRLMRLASSAESFDLMEEYKADAKKYLDESQVYSDSMRYQNDKDSLIRLRMKSRRESVKSYYETKFFCRATVGESNILDTLNMVFDKDFRFVDTRK